MAGLLSRIFTGTLLFTTFVLLGCSSGGDAGVAAPLYSGNTTPAAITLDNAESMGRGATEAVNETVNMTVAGEALPFTVEINASNDALPRTVTDIATRVLQNTVTLDLPTAFILTAADLNQQNSTNEFCGGSVTYPDNVDPEASRNFTISFNQLCFNDGVTALVMNGTLVFTETASAITISFLGFSVDINGRQESFNGTFTCSASLSNCFISTDFIASDGNIYRVADVSVSNTGAGYNIGAMFYHHELGQVSISTNAAITYSNSCGLYPAEGEIMINGSNGSYLTATFNPDCSFTIMGSDGSSSFGPTTRNW